MNHATHMPPRVHCVCCHRPMQSIFQPGFADRPGHFLVTCENLNCDMWGHTLSVENYPPEDLDKYLEYGRLHRLERLARAGEKLSLRDQWHLRQMGQQS